MGNALEEFRAQREAVEDVRARLVEVAGLLQSLRQEAAVLARDQTLRKLLDEEQAWLLRAQDLVRQVQRFRETETSRFWPAVWRRWAVAVVFALVCVATFGAAYAQAERPHDAEMISLRERVEVMDAIAKRIVTMTPAERRQFDALMKLNSPTRQ